MHLFDATMHEPRTTIPWDAARVEEVADRIASDTAAACERDGSWPPDPPDGVADAPDYSFWTGAAGIRWALARLGHDVDEGGLLAGYHSLSDAGEWPGLMHGEVGVLLVSWKLEPTPEKEERLFHLIAANAHNPSHELFNGSPGTMLAALHLYEQTGDDRWRDLWLTCADALLEQFRTDPEYGCRLWIQYRRGRLIRSIGAGHGFASNVHSLLRGAALLDEERLANIQRSAVETATTLALHDRGLVNWPTAADPYWAEDFPIRVQWCHGAPGLVTSLATLPRDDATDGLLEAAAELVWRQARSARAPASVTVRPVTAAPSSCFMPARATRAGTTALVRSRCTRSIRSSAPSRATRSGPATSASRSISGPASTAGTGCRCSTCSSGQLAHPVA